MVRRTPWRVANDNVATPDELKEKNEKTMLFMDVFHACGMAFLSVMGHPTFHRSAEPVGTCAKDELFKSLDIAIGELNDGGLTVEETQCDKAFEPVMNEVKDELGIKLNTSNAQDHAPQAERNNGTLKEAFGTALHRMPHKRTPKTMIVKLIRLCAKRLNWFPAEHGTSKCCSPMTVVTGKTLDYEKHCRYEFGTCVQASTQNAPVNSVKERTIDGIYLGPSDNVQGGHCV